MTGRSSKPRSCRSCRPRSCRPRAPRRHRPDSWCPRSLRTPLSSDCRPRSLTLRTSSHHPSAPKLTRRPRRRRSPMRRGSRRAHEERPRPVDHGPSEAGCNSSPSVGRKALPARERRQTVSDGAGDGGDPVVDTAAVNASIARGGAGRGGSQGTRRGDWGGDHGHGSHGNDLAPPPRRRRSSPPPGPAPARRAARAVLLVPPHARHCIRRQAHLSQLLEGEMSRAHLSVPDPGPALGGRTVRSPVRSGAP